MASQVRGARIVASERYPIEGNRYDLSVFRTGERYYATWFCEYCPTRGMCSGHTDQQAAYEDDVATIRSHHATCHSRND